MSTLSPFRILCALALSLFCVLATAQTTVESLLEQSVTDIPNYDTTGCKTCIFLRVPFGTSEFLNLDVLKRFKGSDIIRVDMVFSSFSRAENFDQVKLNHQRLTSLQSVADELFSNESIMWTMQRQTAGKSLDESERLFHGFVVHIAPGKSKVDLEGKLMPTVSLPEKPSPEKPQITTRDTIIREINIRKRAVTRRDCEFTGKYIPNDKEKARKGIRYNTKGNGRKPERICEALNLGYVYDTMYYTRKHKINTTTGIPVGRSLYPDIIGDITVLDALDRNWDEWKPEKVIVVQDVTGSMFKYLSQILVWHEQYASKGVENYVFFNDGNDKTDAKKVPGETGGIYFVNSNRITDIQSTAQQTTSAGDGGDIPENNMEAVLYAQSKCPDCTMVVMIADNSARVRDFQLLPKVKRPVHIVVCGGNGEQIHSDYLSIAAVTGGSVHTAKIDLDLAGKAVEGEILTIGSLKYRFSAGRFDFVRE